ncbi:hypothetical protein ACFL6U_31510, partial [Planctomycetota bacterium]
AWVTDLLERVLAEVEQECLRTHTRIHWQIFAARVLHPILSNENPVPLSRLCQKLGIKNESQASNMITTVKRRLQKALTRNMEKMGETSPSLNEQVRELLAILQK